MTAKPDSSPKDLRQHYQGPALIAILILSLLLGVGLWLLFAGSFIAEQTIMTPNVVAVSPEPSPVVTPVPTESVKPAI